MSKLFIWKPISENTFCSIRCQSEVRKLEDLLRSKEKEINGLKKTIVEYSLKIDMENMVRAESRNVESQDADSHNSELQNIELQEFESQDVGDVSTEDPSREIDLKPNPVDSAVPLFPVLSCNFDLIDQNYTEWKNKNKETFSFLLWIVIEIFFVRWNKISDFVS